MCDAPPTEALEPGERVVDAVEGGVDAAVPALAPDAVFDGLVDEAFDLAEAVMQPVSGGTRTATSAVAGRATS